MKVTLIIQLKNLINFQIAKEVDPRGVRTLFVVTKLDIMDDGTDAYDLLTGKIYHSDLGFVGELKKVYFII